MKKELRKYLEQFMIQNNWDDECTPRQARSIFTTICLTENIDADTAECDGILAHLYVKTAMNELMSYDEFESYMIELIV